MSGYGAVPLSGMTRGVLTRRFFAYLIDLVVIALFTVLLGFLIGVLGIITFGAAWILYAVLIPLAAILYSGLTVGGVGQGTVGMRMMGLRVVDSETGGRVGFVLACVHALLFYVGIGTALLLALDILIGLARSDRRLGHDLLVGILVLRT